MKRNAKIMETLLNVEFFLFFLEIRKLMFFSIGFFSNAFVKDVFNFIFLIVIYLFSHNRECQIIRTYNFIKNLSPFESGMKLNVLPDGLCQPPTRLNSSNFMLFLCRQFFQTFQDINWKMIDLTMWKKNNRKLLC